MPDDPDYNTADYVTGPKFKQLICSKANPDTTPTDDLDYNAAENENYGTWLSTSLKSNVDHNPDTTQTDDLDYNPAEDDCYSDSGSDENYGTWLPSTSPKHKHLIGPNVDHNAQS